MVFQPSFSLAQIDWLKGDGLVPAIVQDSQSLRVLMLGYMNEKSLALTLETGLVTFWSRARNEIWQKGATSGNTLTLRDIRLDCDQDTLLIFAEPNGPTCHTGARSCFGDEEAVPTLSLLADLSAIVRDRHANAPDGSYTASLFSAGLSRMAQKVGEEGVEVALAAATKADNFSEEVADLLFHLLVLLEARSLSLDAPLRVLATRRLMARKSCTEPPKILDE